MKTKPYNGKERCCQAMAGVDYSGKTPHLIRCKNKATMEFSAIDGKRFVRALVCEGCCERMKKQYANQKISREKDV